MATVTVSDKNILVDDWSGAVGSTTNIGGGAGVQTETDIVFEGSQEWSRKVGAAGGAGWWWTDGVTWDMTDTASHSVIMVILNATNKDVMNSTGLSYRVGDTQSDYRSWKIHDDGSRSDGATGEDWRPYPAKGGWVIVPIEPQLLAWHQNNSGSPDLTIVDEFAVVLATTTTSKAENLVWSALNFINGEFLVGGDGSDDPGEFRDFFLYDDNISRRYGQATESEGILFLYGPFSIGINASGTASATVFTDANSVLVFPGGFVGDTFNKITVDLSNASTTVTWTNVTMISNGQSTYKLYFDTEIDVNSATDVITITDHDVRTSQNFTYSKEGGTEAIGLTDDTSVFPETDTTDTFRVFDNTNDPLDAFSGVSGQTETNLTASTAGNGENHSLLRGPDTRLSIEVASGAGNFTIDGCVFQNTGNCTFASNTSIIGSTFLDITTITPDGATFDGCTFDLHSTPGSSVISPAIPDDITNCEFNQGGLYTEGHALEITATGTYTYIGNTHNGFGPDPLSFDTASNVSTASNSINVSHSYTTGDEVYYEKHGGTEDIGASDSVRYYVRSLATNSLSLHLSKSAAINGSNTLSLTSTTAETHYLESAKAAIFNNSGGAVVIGVDDGDTPSIRNASNATTSITNPVLIRVQGVTEGTSVSVIANEAVGAVSIGDVLLQGFASASGALQSTTFNYVDDIDVIIRARNQGIAIAGLALDEGSFTDETENSNSNATADMTLLP